MKTFHAVAELKLGQLNELSGELATVEKSLMEKEKRVAEVEAVVEKWTGSVGEEGEPVLAIEVEAGLDYDPMDHGMESPQERAASYLVALRAKVTALRARRDELKDRVQTIEPEAKEADLMRRSAWDKQLGRMVKESDGSPTTLRTLLETPHTRDWILHFMSFDQYYRGLPQTRERWINTNMMNAWGGVSECRAWRYVDDELTGLCQLFSRAMLKMFGQFVEILRPEKGEPEELDNLYKEFKKALQDSRRLVDKTGRVTPENEETYNSLIARIESIKKECLGKSYARPDFTNVSSALIEEWDVKWFTLFGNIENSVGTLHDKNLLEARRNYANEIYLRMVAQAGRGTDLDAKRLWQVRAMRAAILLEPTGTNGGAWPIPTASSIAAAHAMLDRHDEAVIEVSGSYWRDSCTSSRKEYFADRTSRLLSAKVC